MELIAGHMGQPECNTNAANPSLDIITITDLKGFLDLGLGGKKFNER